jgi:glucokinase
VTDRGVILVGDVGGTHARFAVVDVSRSLPWNLEHRLDMEDSFPTFIDALRAYFAHSGSQRIPTAAAIAVAGPVTAGRVYFTNRQWEISEDALKEFGFRDALLINDFEALAIAVETLSETDILSVGPELAGMAGAPISILGAGTGFGVSYLVRCGERTVRIATEGGHIGFAPRDDGEIGVLRLLWKQFGRVSIERVLSGPGLEALHEALGRLEGREVVAMSAAEIAAKAVRGDSGCSQALKMFCSIFGSVAGDFALAHGARGGVYIAGGIAQKIEPFLGQSAFRARFEEKGRMSTYVRAIPTKLILNADAALLGAARAGRRFLL